MLLTKHESQGILEVIIAIYLGISIPPISLSLRCTLECLIAGEGAPYSRRRHYASTVLPLLLSLAIALVSPQVCLLEITFGIASSLLCHKEALDQGISVTGISFQSARMEVLVR